MKISARNVLFGISAICMAAAPAQAQTWTNAAGAPLALGTPISAAGKMIFTLFPFSPITCDVSMEGTITAADTITFTHGTPGFVSNCNVDDQGAVEFPFDVKAQFSGASFTGEHATGINIFHNTMVGPCGVGSLKFAWYDAPMSEGQLHSAVIAAPCTLNAGSWLRITGTYAGNVSIN